MQKWVSQLKDYFDPPQNGTVEYQYYVRTGQCNSCGQCCSGIHLIHGDSVIESVEQFERLKQQHEDYRHFVPIDESDIGLVFRCSNLQPDNTCGIYDDRPLFCKKYPSEATLMFGGVLAPKCGFAFQAKHRFGEILKQAAERKRLNPGKLLNDVVPGARYLGGD